VSAISTTLRGRLAAEKLMIDSVTIRHQTGEATDPDTGVITPTLSTVYSGAAKVGQSAVPSGSPRDLGQASVTLIHLTVHVPMSVTGVKVDDLVTVDASTLDPALVGRVFRVTSIGHKTYQTARRFDVQEQDS
jgi:hypothetical protein